MMAHLEESTNIVKSNQKLIGAIIVQIILIGFFILVGRFIPENEYYLAGVFCLVVISSSFLLYQIIKKL